MKSQKEKMKNFIVGALIIGLAIVVGFMVKPAGQLGANPGPEYFNLQYFYGGMVQGGAEVTLTSAATTTFTAKQFCENSLINWGPGYGGGATMTIPTAATLANTCLAKAGATKDIYFYNTSALAASTTAFATSTGIRLVIPEATGADAVIAGGDRALLRFVRTNEGSSTTIDVLLLEQTRL